MDIFQNKDILDKIYNEMKQINYAIKKVYDTIECKFNNKAQKGETTKEKRLSDYDKIVLKDLESRITILEEESQKYTINRN